MSWLGIRSSGSNTRQGSSPGLGGAFWVKFGAVAMDCGSSKLMKCVSMVETSRPWNSKAINSDDPRLSRLEQNQTTAAPETIVTKAMRTEFLACSVSMRPAKSAPPENHGMAGAMARAYFSAKTQANAQAQSARIPNRAI